ncbi:hypothetical protein HR060_02800 [Catenovulum sp. SM1970]|uniref:hypothetical protein n=1 Tax=Marinifaba aquimaris TaxID=2741323 RepID=UPI00157402B1|nr:hypothetical protein [Marinifaba aquimaris]NTS75784.1 hypothetical protein [Marinifaba aquimaris]
MTNIDLLETPASKQLKRKIRFGSEANNPALLALWFTQEESVMDGQSLANKRVIYIGQFRLLLEAVVDELVPRHWRQACLDQIYKPLSALQRLVTSDESEQQLKSLLAELAITTRYVERSLNK